MFTLKKNKYKINYFITDHLGSTRVIIDNAGNIKAQYNYYPFGKQWEDVNLMANTNRWGYNGKEKQTIRNLGYWDYSARMLDAEIGRWFCPDPLAEKYYSISPYVYCVNNPVRYIDPDGMDINKYYNASPAFDINGNFLGTDDEGYSGNILIFDDPAQFSQGMAHNEAIKKGRTLRSHLDVSDYALNRIINHVANNTILPDGNTLYSSLFFAYYDNLSK